MDWMPFSPTTNVASELSHPPTESPLARTLFHEDDIVEDMTQNKAPSMQNFPKKQPLSAITNIQGANNNNNIQGTISKSPVGSVSELKMKFSTANKPNNNRKKFPIATSHMNKRLNKKGISSVTNDENVKPTRKVNNVAEMQKKIWKTDATKPPVVSRSNTPSKTVSIPMNKVTAMKRVLLDFEQNQTTAYKNEASMSSKKRAVIEARLNKVEDLRKWLNETEPQRKRGASPQQTKNLNLPMNRVNEMKNWLVDFERQNKEHYKKYGSMDSRRETASYVPVRGTRSGEFMKNGDANVPKETNAVEIDTEQMPMVSQLKNWLVDFEQENKKHFEKSKMRIPFEKKEDDETTNIVADVEDEQEMINHEDEEEERQDVKEDIQSRETEELIELEHDPCESRTTDDIEDKDAVNTTTAHPFDESVFAEDLNIESGSGRGEDEENDDDSDTELKQTMKKKVLVENTSLLMDNPPLQEINMSMMPIGLIDNATEWEDEDDHADLTTDNIVSEVEGTEENMNLTMDDDGTVEDNDVEKSTSHTTDDASENETYNAEEVDQNNAKDLDTSLDETQQSKAILLEETNGSMSDNESEEMMDGILLGDDTLSHSYYEGRTSAASYIEINGAFVCNTETDKLGKKKNKGAFKKIFRVFTKPFVRSGKNKMLEHEKQTEVVAYKQEVAEYKQEEKQEMSPESQKASYLPMQFDRKDESQAQGDEALVPLIRNIVAESPMSLASAFENALSPVSSCMSAIGDQLSPLGEDVSEHVGWLKDIFNSPLAISKSKHLQMKQLRY